MAEAASRWIPEGKVEGYELLEDALDRAIKHEERDPAHRRVCSCSLRLILGSAYDQAASGKGKARHACGRPWDLQPIFSIPRLLADGTFNLGQAMKKLQELERMDYPQARREALGAIIYLASAVVLVDQAEPWEEASHGWAPSKVRDGTDQIVGRLAKSELVRGPIESIGRAIFAVHGDEARSDLFDAIIGVVSLIDTMDACEAGDRG